MNPTVTNYLDTKHIDTVLKLHVLLFLCQHPDLQGTGRELAERSYFGDTPHFEKILGDLCGVGLVDRLEHGYQLCHKPDVMVYLHTLAQTFEDPLTRQEMLAHLH